MRDTKACKTLATRREDYARVEEVEEAGISEVVRENAASGGKRQSCEHADERIRIREQLSTRIEEIEGALFTEKAARESAARRKAHVSRAKKEMRKEAASDEKAKRGDAVKEKVSIQCNPDAEFTVRKEVVRQKGHPLDGCELFFREEALKRVRFVGHRHVNHGANLWYDAQARLVRATFEAPHMRRGEIFLYNEGVHVRTEFAAGHHREGQATIHCEKATACDARLALKPVFLDLSELHQLGVDSCNEKAAVSARESVKASAVDAQVGRPNKTDEVVAARLLRRKKASDIAVSTAPPQRPSKAKSSSKGSAFPSSQHKADSLRIIHEEVQQWAVHCPNCHTSNTRGEDENNHVHCASCKVEFCFLCKTLLRGHKERHSEKNHFKHNCQQHGTPLMAPTLQALHRLGANRVARPESVVAMSVATEDVNVPPVTLHGRMRASERDVSHAQMQHVIKHGVEIRTTNKHDEPSILLRDGTRKMWLSSDGGCVKSVA